jgi:hypothetical protein
MTALPTRHGIAGAALAVCLGLMTAPLHAQPDFGDNTSRWANDGECDDPRFEGEAAADTLLDDDRGHDATDCRKLFNAGRIALRSPTANANGAVAFGDDSSEWARDGECDDPRFEGEGSAETLLDEDNGHDATDCRSLLDAGRIALRGGTSTVDFGDDSGEWARDGECDDPRFQGEGSAATLLDADAYHDATDCRTLLTQGRISLRGDAAAADLKRGRLEKGDDTLSSGEFSDAYTFAGTPDQRAVIDLRSGEFDPYVFVRAPSGEQFDNDDFEGDASRSLLSLDLTESGEYRVTVTSYSKGETGGYTLSIDVGRSAGMAARMDHSGELEKGDETLTSGEFVDSYEFEGSPGQHVSIDLRSPAFDTYLILKDPAGEQTENDDADDGGVGHSSIEADLTEAGTYQVMVTSYESGESGSYELSIDPTAASERSPADREVTTLAVGGPVSGELGEGDPTFEAGEFHDLYVFDGDEGETIRVELSSAEFDTYLGLVTPSGEEIANDDFEGDTERSVIALTLPEAGRYRVQATSYGAAETGRYRLALTTSTADIPVERRSQGRVYGLFAGISDYEGSSSDLQYTAEDATRIRDALIGGGGMRAQDAVTFVDSDATVGNITAAIHDIAGRMQPEDTFVMFYSGHGGQVPRGGGASASDPDAMDETLALYDGALLDDDLASLFDEIADGTVLLWLDSCFSGGFAKDIVSAPGRMGIFSSEEDITSNVADKFRAGGYLSHFLDEAIAQGLADDDKNDSITAIELSQYLHERYRSDVKSARPVDVVRTEMTLGYQHLVVDRGSIGAYDVLFER